MRIVNKKVIVMASCFALVTLFNGCTNWKDEYDKLNIKYQNCLGLNERGKQENQQLAADVQAKQQEIDELQKQIEQQKKTPAQASGFGEGYNVKFDPNAGTITVTLDNTVLFDSGKVELKKASITELDHIQSVLKQRYPSKQIDVVGHTDTDPINKTKDLWKDNWELSAQRSLAVVRYLVGRGLDPKMVREVGCGEARPVSSNSTVQGKAKNRRVEIVVHVK
jgi:chemotaxis protein MotB